MRPGVVWMWVLLASVLMVPGAWAQRPPETHPSRGLVMKNVAMNWDRSAMPEDIELWAPRTVLAYDGDDLTLGYGQLHVVCVSNSNPNRGSCPEAGIEEASLGLREIVLSFVERRSQQRTDLRLRGGIERALSGRACLGNFWQNGILAPWSTYSLKCALDEPAGTGIQLHLPRAELAQLVAGVWSAQLDLKANTPSEQGVEYYSFKFDFTITDYDAVSIYFPEFPQTTPNVDLNLRYDPLNQTVGGRKPLEMCLYDGLGSQSEYLGVTVTDTSGRTPGPLGYSLWHDDGGSGDDQRLDYMIELEHAGARRRMASGVEEQLRDIDTAQLRLVLLPGMTQPVFCVPTPLLLTTPRVPITEQRAGGYEGELKVQLRLPTTRP
ncbi:pilin protein [Stenotrophomonas maltophilia]|nr:pilin protein [Stenotrophomonas maltophilia]MBA0343583.1 pilin protein [Stenotrophomonas maltophilia]MBA0358526.1 pilin protein [Stenotrophomonas maltophilia]MBA0520531.1 pilin protein [Stenotrophomonas maltophilia]